MIENQYIETGNSEVFCQFGDIIMEYHFGNLYLVIWLKETVSQNYVYKFICIFAHGWYLKPNA